jgi:hypothetical protein
MMTRNFYERMDPHKPNTPSFEAENPEPPDANGIFCVAPSIGANGRPVNLLCLS